VEAAILGSDPPLRSYSIQDYDVRIADNWSAWLAMVIMFRIAGAFALALAATGMGAYLTQPFVERRQPTALRFALGALVRNVWGWLNRQNRVCLINRRRSSARTVVRRSDVADGDGPGIRRPCRLSSCSVSRRRSRSVGRSILVRQPPCRLPPTNPLVARPHGLRRSTP
jgi:hypothetical protein